MSTNTRASTDLTEGSVIKKLITFAIPIIAGNIFMQLYNVVDSIVIGQFLGSDPLAAVSLSFPIMMLFNALFIGLSMGANILVSQYKGAGDYDSMGKTVNNTFSLCVIIGSIITILGVVLCRPLLKLLGTPANIIDDAVLYLAIIFLGTIGNTIYSLSQGLMRGLGDSRWPLYALIIAFLMNVVLDTLFVVVFHWGVAGVAIATVIAQVFSGLVLMIRFMKGKYGFKLTFSGMKKLNGNIIKMIFRLGIPTSIQNGAMSLGMVIIQSFANNFGSGYIAANGVIQRVDGFVLLPLMGIGMAVTTFVGQNIGAGNVERAKQGTYSAIKIIVSFSLVMGVILYFFGSYFMRAFTDDPEVLDMGMHGMRFLAFFYVFMGINQSVSGAVRGAGAASVPAATSIIGTLIRLPLAYFLAVLPFNRDISNSISAGLYATKEAAQLAGVGLDHYMGLFYSMGISMFCGAFMIMMYFIFGKWQTKGVVKHKMSVQS